MSIENNKDLDPFAEVDESDGEGEKKATKAAEKIEIRIQQRNGRKTLTTVTNIPKKWNLKKICKQAKKRYNCNGTVIEDEEHGQVIQLQGDQRNNMHDFLCGEITNDEKNTGLGFNKDMVRVHGF
ncbi:translation initiation factor SUI1 [Coniella lustricola]|uniref:Translation initiation factor SUI1 n=1 Tax=Coniella lustricola TaxID=2025994 RepID=A0A2T2ZRY3_9PEZI|nr:translation initiation factor SUI1 [Coniella lustricola]